MKLINESTRFNLAQFGLAALALASIAQRVFSPDLFRNTDELASTPAVSLPPRAALPDTSTVESNDLADKKRQEVKESARQLVERAVEESKYDVTEPFFSALPADGSQEITVRIFPLTQRLKGAYPIDDVFANTGPEYSVVPEWLIPQDKTIIQKVIKSLNSQFKQEKDIKVKFKIISEEDFAQELNIQRNSDIDVTIYRSRFSGKATRQYAATDYSIVSGKFSAPIIINSGIKESHNGVRETTVTHELTHLFSPAHINEETSKLVLDRALDRLELGVNMLDFSPLALTMELVSCENKFGSAGAREAACFELEHFFKSGRSIEGYRPINFGASTEFNFDNNMRFGEIDLCVIRSKFHRAKKPFFIKESAEKIAQRANYILNIGHKDKPTKGIEAFEKAHPLPKEIKQEDFDKSAAVLTDEAMAYIGALVYQELLPQIGIKAISEIAKEMFSQPQIASAIDILGPQLVNIMKGVLNHGMQSMDSSLKQNVAAAMGELALVAADYKGISYAKEFALGLHLIPESDSTKDQPEDFRASAEIKALAMGLATLLLTSYRTLKNQPHVSEILEGKEKLDSLPIIDLTGKTKKEKEQIILEQYKKYQKEYRSQLQEVSKVVLEPGNRKYGESCFIEPLFREKDGDQENVYCCAFAKDTKNPEQPVIQQDQKNAHAIKVPRADVEVDKLSAVDSSPSLYSLHFRPVNKKAQQVDKVSTATKTTKRR